MKKQDDPGEPRKPLQLKQSFFEVLDELKGQGCTAASVTEGTSVTPAALSAFKNGNRNIGVSSFQSLIDALPAVGAASFYRKLGGGEVSPRQVISDLLAACNDRELMDLVDELGHLVSERQSQSNEEGSISAFRVISRMVDFIDIRDLPNLLQRIGKYVETSMPNLPNDVGKDTHLS